MDRIYAGPFTGMCRMHQQGTEVGVGNRQGLCRHGKGLGLWITCTYLQVLAVGRNVKLFPCGQDHDTSVSDHREPVCRKVD